MLLRVDFFDLDGEVEKYFDTSIERLQNQFLTIHSYREKAAEALVHLLARPESRASVIALPPSGPATCPSVGTGCPPRLDFRFAPTILIVTWHLAAPRRQGQWQPGSKTGRHR